MNTLKHEVRGYEDLISQYPDTLEGYIKLGAANGTMSESEIAQQILEREAKYMAKRPLASAFETKVAKAVIEREGLDEAEVKKNSAYENDKGNYSQSIFLGAHDKLEKSEAQALLNSIPFPAYHKREKSSKVSVKQALEAEIAEMVGSMVEGLGAEKAVETLTAMVRYGDEAACQALVDQVEAQSEETAETDNETTE